MLLANSLLYLDSSSHHIPLLIKPSPHFLWPHLLFSPSLSRAQDVRGNVRRRAVRRDGRADDRAACACDRQQLQHVLLALAGAIQTPEAPATRAARRGRTSTRLYSTPIFTFSY